MLATVEELQTYTGVYPEDDESQQSMYLGSANDIIINYLGYNPVQSERNETSWVLSPQLYLTLKSIPAGEITCITLNGIAKDISKYQVVSSNLLSLADGTKLETGLYSISYKGGFSEKDIPSIFKLTCLRIAGILQTESNNNIGISSKSFQDSGTRTFVNTVNFEKYLLPLSNYKLV